MDTDIEESEILSRLQNAIDAAMRAAALDPNNPNDSKAFRDWLVRSVKENREGYGVDLDVVARKAKAWRNVEKVQAGETSNPTRMIRAGYQAQNVEKESADVELNKENKSATPYDLISLGYARRSTERIQNNDE